MRQEIKELKITYRPAPGGIRFTEEDLLVRLRPSGGPAFSRKTRLKKEEKLKSGDKPDDLTVSWRFSDQDTWPCGQGASFSTVIGVISSAGEVGVSIIEEARVG